MNLTFEQAMVLLNRSNGWDINPEVLEELSKMDLVTADGRLTRYGEHVVKELPLPRAPKGDASVWISQDGRHIPIVNLETTHLRNIINFILQRNYAHELDAFRREQCTNLLREAFKRQMSVPSEFLTFCLQDAKI